MRNLDELLSRFKDLNDLPVSEEMIGAFLDGPKEGNHLLGVTEGDDWEDALYLMNLPYLQKTVMGDFSRDRLPIGTADQILQELDGLLASHPEVWDKSNPELKNDNNHKTTLMTKEELSTLYTDVIEIAHLACKNLDKSRQDSPYMGYAHQLLELKKRFDRQELNVLVAGEVSTGKSSFINAILGIDLLTTADEACTNVPTKIAYGRERTCVVHFRKDPANDQQRESQEINVDQIKDFSSERSNPKNAAQVDFIEIRIDDPILQKGLVFIDTPGMGAIDPRHALATFNIATEADIILFLGWTGKQLTASEIANLVNLIKCSKCENIAHILTWCDKGHPDVIMNENKQEIRKQLKDKELRFFQISSTMYQDYLKNGDKDDLEDSGFLDVAAYIEGINATVSEFMVKRYTTLLSGIVLLLKKDIDLLMQAAKDPVAAENRRAELNRLLNRLQTIEDNRIDWTTRLHERQALLENKVYDFIDREHQKLVSHMESLVEQDLYLNDKDLLANTIQADMVAMKESLCNKVSQGFVEIYDWLRIETQLDKVKDKIYSPNIDVENVVIPDSCGDIPASVQARNVFISAGMGILGGSLVSVALGTTAGAAVLAKAGALLGTTIAPGVGTAIGAAIGAVTGFLATRFQTKKQKQQQIAAKCRENISSFIRATKSSIKESNISNSSEIERQFLNELRNDKKFCLSQYEKINEMATNLRSNWDKISTLSKSIDQIWAVLMPTTNV